MMLWAKPAENPSGMRWALAKRFLCCSTPKLRFALILLVSALELSAREKDAVQYGMGLIINLPFPENEVVQVVEDVVQNGVIRGTQEYNNDQYVSGAKAADSTRVFPEWTQGGKVFYKVRLKALDPRNFKDTNDVGTLAVRYVVQPQGENNTLLRIDAVFVEEFRHISHASNGSVESAEYKDIHDQLDALDVMKLQAAEAQKEKPEHAQSNAQHVHVEEAPASTEQQRSADPLALANVSPATSIGDPSPVPQTPEERVRDLRRQVQRLVKAPGAPLKSAPFHTATTLHSLPAGTEVLIVITTPYWFGVETHEGQHGWMLRDELEFVP